MESDMREIIDLTYCGRLLEPIGCIQFDLHNEEFAFAQVDLWQDVGWHRDHGYQLEFDKFDVHYSVCHEISR